MIMHDSFTTYFFPTYIARKYKHNNHGILYCSFFLKVVFPDGDEPVCDHVLTDVFSGVLHVLGGSVLLHTSLSKKPKLDAFHEIPT